MKKGDHWKMKHNPYETAVLSAATVPSIEDEAHPKQLLFPDWAVFFVTKKEVTRKKIKPVTKRNNGVTSTSFIFDDFVLDAEHNAFPCMAVVVAPRDIVHRFARETKQTIDISVDALLTDIFDPPKLRDSQLSVLYAYVKAHMYVIESDVLASHALHSTKWSAHLHKELRLSGRFKAGVTNLATATDTNFSNLDDHLPTCAGDAVLCRGELGMHLLMFTLHGIPIVSVKKIMSTKIAENIRTATAQLVDIERQQSEEEFIQESEPFVLESTDACAAAGVKSVYVPPEAKNTDITPVTIDETDISTLHSTGMFTDNVVHWVLLDYIIEASSRHSLSDCFVFNTHMASRLSCVDMHDNRSAMSLKDRMSKFFYEHLKSFATYHVDGRTDADSVRSLLFDKDYLFFPYNHDDTHWALYVFYKPYAPNVTAPIAYVFDSAFVETQQERNVIPASVHSANVIKLRFYLKNVVDEYARFESRVIRIELKRSILIVKCPQQPHNTNACGLYMCEYIRCFITSAEARQAAMDRLINTVCVTRRELTEARKRTVDGEYTMQHRVEPTFLEDEMKYINRTTVYDITKDIVEKLKAVNVAQQQELIKRNKKQ